MSRIILPHLGLPCIIARSISSASADSARVCGDGGYRPRVRYRRLPPEQEVQGRSRHGRRTEEIIGQRNIAVVKQYIIGVTSHGAI